MRKQFILFCLLIASAALLPAQDGFKKMTDTKAFEQKVNSIAQQTNTIQCNFIQEKTLSFMEDKIVSEGRFFFKKEDQLRWEYTEPFSYIIILDDGKLMIDDEGNQNEINLKSNKTFQEINQLLTRSLQGDILGESDKFSYEILEGEKQYLVKLTPVDPKMKEYMSRIDVYFDKADMMVAGVDMHEQSEDMTSIRFSKRKVNEAVPSELFRL